jgi:uncharacterized repeat protein (TIGR01451 family)
MKTKRSLVLSGGALFLMLVLLGAMRWERSPVRAAWDAADSLVVPHAPAVVWSVCLGGPPTCDYASVRAAVVGATGGDVIKVATGTYTGTEVLLNIDKTITIQGGYTTDDWATPDPQANPTTLDAQGLGSVINVSGGQPTIEGLRITGGDAGSLGGGGGVNVLNASVTLRNNWVFGNTALQGGGIYLRASENATLSGNTIESNTAGYGGGLFLNRASVLMSDNMISANTAITRGGGLLLFESDDATVSGNAVTANVAENGGGVYLDRSNAVVGGNDLRANSASQGGGLYLDNSNTMLFNNVIADNDVGAAGGGLYVVGSSPRLLHNTIARNSGNEGVYVTGNSNIELINTILSTHTVGINVAGGSNASLDATVWYANTENWDGAGVIDAGARNYSSDPDFVAPSGGDYHIGNLSAALDTGMGVGVSADMDGEQRPRGSGYDIGADEFPDLLSVTKKASTKPARPGEQLVYVIHITNFDSIAYTAAITDVLPENVTPTGLITWTSEVLSPDSPWERQVSVVVDVGYTGTLTNTVIVTTDEGETGAAVLITEIHITHLPIVLRES